MVYSATSFAAGTEVKCGSKIFQDELKTNPNNSCMGVNAEFSKFPDKTVLRNLF